MYGSVSVWVSLEADSDSEWGEQVVSLRGKNNINRRGRKWDGEGKQPTRGVLLLQVTAVGTRTLTHRGNLGPIQNSGLQSGKQVTGGLYTSSVMGCGLLLGVLILQLSDSPHVDFFWWPEEALSKEKQGLPVESWAGMHWDGEGGGYRWANASIGCRWWLKHLVEVHRKFFLKYVRNRNISKFINS